MKQGWEIKPFEEILEKVKYSKKIPKQQYKKRGTYPIVSQEQEIISGFWDEKNDLFRLNKPIVIFGDHTKVVKYIDFDFVIGADGVKILSPTEEILTKYLYYFVLSVNLRDLGYARHFRLLKEQKIPVPSLLEQGRIVEVLDAAFAKIDALKENAQKNLENAKALFQQVLKQELTPKPNWQTKKLGEVCKYIKEQGSYSNLPYVGMEDIEPETNKYLGKLIPKNVKSTTFKFHQGYVLFGRLRPYLRKVLTPKFEGHCSTEIFPIQPCQDINCEFLRFWFLDNIDDINRTCTGARMPRANMNDVLNFVISYPQIDEQEEIVLKIENITQKSNKVIANAEKTIAECDALKQAVLRRAFNGEL